MNCKIILSNQKHNTLLISYIWLKNICLTVSKQNYIPTTIDKLEFKTLVI
ncbi:hypothetical protein VCHA43P277_90088 [Vibrio chagasii]|nr:hypothetical protein VCHA29O39_110089 [Vibrio chagasii]CAH6872204.1 hypothetical protein VCHA37O173_20153 [Vibrio chagasii]CAH7057776.1 hypothetical protein VCHA36P161_70087 [Vibrio chagasii]CAH7090053.1 hypothetical protein VCHA34P126_80155 [Vibrio chagasii]CAH7396513.1 hypothetical protein VCHA43P277_90088 [Vibrio chagasii]